MFFRAWHASIWGLHWEHPFEPLQHGTQVEAREESPVLLERLPLGEADPVKQLAQKLDACALNHAMGAAVIKSENMSSSPGECNISGCQMPDKSASHVLSMRQCLQCAETFLTSCVSGSPHTLLSVLKCDKMLSIFPTDRMRVKCVQKVSPKCYLIFTYLPQLYIKVYPVLPKWQQHCSNRRHSDPACCWKAKVSKSCSSHFSPHFAL